MRPAAEQWIKQAEEDLRFARSAQEGQFFAWACFVCQQATEKALKAFLVERTNDVPKTHRLLELASDCQQYEPAFAQFRPQLDVLNQYYAPTRYADLHGSAAPYEHYTNELATEALSFATKIVTFVSQQLQV